MSEAERGERLPEGPRTYVPVIAADHLAYCTECGVVVVGDRVGTLMHEIWHGQYERVKDGARWGRTLRPLAGRPSASSPPGAAS